MIIHPIMSIINIHVLRFFLLMANGERMIVILTIKRNLLGYQGKKGLGFYKGGEKMYRSNNKEFINQKIIKEIAIFLDDKKHCIINDDDTTSKQIDLLSRLYPDKVLRIEGEVKYD